jgi:hypothetical protein
MEKWQLENEENIQRIKNIFKCCEENYNVVNYSFLYALYFQIKTGEYRETYFEYEEYNHKKSISGHSKIYSDDKNITYDECYIIIDFLYRSEILNNLEYLNLYYQDKKFVRFLGKSKYCVKTGLFISKEIREQRLNEIKSELEKYRIQKELKDF